MHTASQDKAQTHWSALSHKLIIEKVDDCNAIISLSFCMERNTSLRQTNEPLKECDRYSTLWHTRSRSASDSYGTMLLPPTVRTALW